MTDKEHLDLFEQKYNELRNEMAKVIVGQQEAVDSLLLSVFTGGHCLLLGVPGLAKTLMVNTLAQTLGLSFSRIQFTPDLMPSDITGSEILDRERNFKFIQGPVFAGRLCSRLCRTIASQSRALPTRCPTLSSSSPRRTPSSRKAPIRFPRHSSTVSCSMSDSTIPPSTRRCRLSVRPPSTAMPR